MLWEKRTSFIKETSTKTETWCLRRRQTTLHPDRKKPCQQKLLPSLSTIASSDVLMIFKDAAYHSKDGKSAYGYVMVKIKFFILARIFYWKIKTKEFFG